MARERAGGGAAEELAAKLAAVEAGVGEREARARAVDEEARAEHERLIQEMADMVEGNQALNERVEKAPRDFVSAYRRIEHDEWNRLAASERSIEEDRETIANMEIRVQSLAEKGEDVAGLQSGLEELKQALTTREAEVEEEKQSIEELRRTNNAFLLEQSRVAQDQAGFAIETTFAQKEYAADPNVLEAKKLPDEERGRLKGEVAAELARREQERQQERCRQEDQKRVQENQRIIQEVRREFLDIKANAEEQMGKLEAELADEGLAARVREQKDAIKAKLGGRYFLGKSRRAAGAEAQELLEALQTERQALMSRVTDFENQTRSVFSLIRDHGNRHPSFYCLSTDKNINTAMKEAETELEALNQEMQNFADRVLSSQNKPGNKGSELFGKVNEIFGDYKALESLKNRVFDLQREKKQSS